MLGNIKGFIDVARSLLPALQLIDELENAVCVFTSMAEHHFAIDTPVGPTEAEHCDL